MNLIECDEKTGKDIMSYPEKYTRSRYIYSYFDHKLNHDVWIAIDNDGTWAWTEAFRKRNIAEAWLRGEFEAFDVYDDDKDMIPIYEKYGCNKEDILE